MTSNGIDRERARLVALALAVAPTEARREWVLTAPTPALAAYVERRAADAAPQDPQTPTN